MLRVLRAKFDCTLRDCAVLEMLGDLSVERRYVIYMLLMWSLHVFNAVDGDF